MNTHQPITFDEGLYSFTQALTAANKSTATIAAYQADIRQFLTWLAENSLVAVAPGQVGRADITDYLAFLAGKQLSGLSRARKLAAIREYFRYLVSIEALSTSPAATIPTPKKEKKETTFLSRTEYTHPCTRRRPRSRLCHASGIPSAGAACLRAGSVAGQ